MGRYTGKTCRLIAMLAMTASFFFVEIVVGYITNSIALIGDSYHMLSDVISLVIGLTAVRISKWDSKKNTFGWARAEVLGALVNAVFLIALCFTILIEAIQRLFRNEEIHNPDLMLIVGGIGLGINLIGLGLFAGNGHGHSHGGGGGGHGHSHGGGHGHAHSPKHGHSHDHSDGGKHGYVNEIEDAPHTDSKVTIDTVDRADTENKATKKPKSSAQLNMRAVFLHVLGDALGSVVVIISALALKYIDADWKYKVDPCMSLVLVVIIFSTTLPLLKESSLILLQTAPTHIAVAELQDRLLDNVCGILAVHEFHVWQLAGSRIIASAHIRCRDIKDYTRIAEETKHFFHDEGIHSTTIQPEFTGDENPAGTAAGGAAHTTTEQQPAADDRDCALECGPDKTCYTDTCCGTKVRKSSTTHAQLSPKQLRQRQKAPNSNGHDGDHHMQEIITEHL